jgi:hypothetical protein
MPVLQKNAKHVVRQPLGDEPAELDQVFLQSPALAMNELG